MGVLVVLLGGKDKRLHNQLNSLHQIKILMSYHKFHVTEFFLNSQSNMPMELCKYDISTSFIQSVNMNFLKIFETKYIYTFSSSEPYFEAVKWVYGTTIYRNSNPSKLRNSWFSSSYPIRKEENSFQEPATQWEIQKIAGVSTDLQLPIPESPKISIIFLQKIWI